MERMQWQRFTSDNNSGSRFAGTSLLRLELPVFFSWSRRELTKRPWTFLMASKTGTLTLFPLIGISLTRYARHFASRWISALFVAACSFFADALIHESHYPGAYTEAAFTAAGAFALSVIVSYTPLGKTDRSSCRSISGRAANNCRINRGQLTERLTLSLWERAG